MDLGTIDFKVRADTSGITQANESVDSLSQHAQATGDQLDSMGNKVGESGRKIRAGMKQANDGMKQTGQTARQLGFQLQDSIVQLQGGASAATVFAQQGSQMFSVFHPMAGLFAALAGVVGGALAAAFGSAALTSDELSDAIKELNKDYDALMASQRAFLINEEVRKQKELTEQIEEQEDAIRRLEIRYAAVQKRQAQGETPTGTATFGQSTQLVTTLEDVIKASNKLTEARANLETMNQKVMQSDKEIAKLNGQTLPGEEKKLSNAQRQLQSLKDEQAQLALTGAALGEYLAKKSGATAAETAQMQALQMSIDLYRTWEKAQKEALQTRAQAAREEKTRIESLDRLNAQLQQEAAMVGKVSKAEEIELGIRTGLIKVTGGLAGVEAQRLLVSAKALDLATEQQRRQDEYVEKLNEWVKAEYEKKEQIRDIIGELEQQNAELTNTADTYLEIRLRALGATEAEVQRAKELSRSNRALKDRAKAFETTFERLDGFGASMWEGMLTGSRDALDSVKTMFIQTLAEMAHEAVTKPIIMQFQQAMTGGASGGKAGGGITGALGMGGIYAAAGIAVVAVVDSFNKKQDEIARKMSAEYRQSTQSLGTVLGESGKKSESIANSISLLSEYADDTLSVNYQMYQALRSIDEGINGVAAGFARQFSLGGTADFSDIETGTSGLKRIGQHGFFEQLSDRANKILSFGNSDLAEFVGGFANGIMDGINKAVYSKKVKIIDTGIGFVGQTLADILATGAIDAFAYAEVRTKKKVIGVTTSSKVRTEQRALDDVLLDQFADVFTSAGEALEQVAPLFERDFEQILSQLQIDPSKLSLKGLEGDALVQEIEAFFSSTLDNWAGVLVEGTDVLTQFQQVGEGAFETVIRLASELNLFTGYADALNLQFNATGLAAIDASQNIAEMAGGIDSLTGSLSGYYNNFFTEAERSATLLDQLTNELTGMGLATPKTRQEFRALIESLDLSAASGQEQFAKLISLQGMFAEVFPAAANSATNAIDTLMSSLNRSVDAERRILSGQMDTINNALSTSRAVYSALESSLSGLVAVSDRTAAATRRQAQAQLSGMLGSARQGQLPDLAALNDTLSVLTRPSARMFGSFEDYIRDIDRTAGEIKALQDVTGKQVSTEEKALSELQKQSDFLDELTTWAKAQVDALNGVDTSVISVAQALSAFASAVGVQYPTAAQQMALAQMSQQAETTRQDTQVSDVQAVAAAQQAQLKTFQDSLLAAQVAIVENGAAVRKILNQFEAIGVPIRNESITALAVAIGEEVA